MHEHDVTFSVYRKLLCFPPPQLSSSSIGHEEEEIVVMILLHNTKASLSIVREYCEEFLSVCSCYKSESLPKRLETLRHPCPITTKSKIICS